MRSATLLQLELTPDAAPLRVGVDRCQLRVQNVAVCQSAQKGKGEAEQSTVRIEGAQHAAATLCAAAMVATGSR